MTRQIPQPRSTSKPAAPYEAFFLEIAYKGIEILAACSVILGSSAGTWLGLTVGSMFPQRIAAGLYTSSYGQVLPRKDIPLHETPARWRPAGTLWTDSYCIEPDGVISDTWRDALGYWCQYAGLIVVQVYKLQIRLALEFGTYSITRDAIRYILLVIQSFILIICGLVMIPKLDSHAKRRDLAWGGFYLIMLFSGLACLVLGQKSFLKPIWKFYLTSKLVEPIAAAGTVAAMNVARQEDGRILPEKWVLMWVMGACTVAW